MRLESGVMFVRFRDFDCFVVCEGTIPDVK